MSSVISDQGLSVRYYLSALENRVNINDLFGEIFLQNGADTMRICQPMNMSSTRTADVCHSYSQAQLIFPPHITLGDPP